MGWRGAGGPGQQSSHGGPGVGPGQGAHPFKGHTSVPRPDGLGASGGRAETAPSAPAPPAPGWSPRGRRATLAGRPATHVVLAGDEALLEAQEGDVADEGVPHDWAAGPPLLWGAPWLVGLKWARKRKSLGEGEEGQEGAGRAPEDTLLLLSVSGIPQTPVAGTWAATRPGDVPAPHPSLWLPQTFHIWPLLFLGHPKLLQPPAFALGATGTIPVTPFHCFRVSAQKAPPPRGLS